MFRPPMQELLNIEQVFYRKSHEIKINGNWATLFILAILGKPLMSEVQWRHAKLK
jgi:hypothetical protein